MLGGREERSRGCVSEECSAMRGWGWRCPSRSDCLSLAICLQLQLPLDFLGVPAVFSSLLGAPGACSYVLLNSLPDCSNAEANAGLAPMPYLY